MRCERVWGKHISQDQTAQPESSSSSRTQKASPPPSSLPSSLSRLTESHPPIRRPQAASSDLALPGGCCAPAFFVLLVVQPTRCARARHRRRATSEAACVLHAFRSPAPASLTAQLSQSSPSTALLSSLSYTFRPSSSSPTPSPSHPPPSQHRNSLPYAKWSSNCKARPGWTPRTFTNTRGRWCVWWAKWSKGIAPWRCWGAGRTGRCGCK